jgi:cytoskeletal protein RodZ
VITPNSERVQFGARLRQQRESKSLTVPDVVKQTKIPEKTLQHLEEGAFELLPAEVFVRGFLKSYCRAVGLDVDATIRDYEAMVRERKPRVPSLARLGAMRGDSAQLPSVPGAADRDKDKDKAADKEKEKEKDEVSVFAALADAGKGTGRMGLTLAVIVLVIVATLTLSLLLRRPGRAGDGVSAAAALVEKVV